MDNYCFEEQLKLSEIKFLENKPFLATVFFNNLEHHAGILINSPEIGLFLFHFDGDPKTDSEGRKQYIKLEKITAVELDKGNCLFNCLVFIRPNNFEMDLIMARFGKIRDSNNNLMRYGYYFGDASFIGQDGKYQNKSFSINAFITNCVGFCLLVIEDLLKVSSFATTTYMERSTWGLEGLDEDLIIDTRKKLARKTNPEDLEKAIAEIRRIPPIHFLGASFLGIDFPFNRQTILGSGVISFLEGRFNS